MVVSSEIHQQRISDTTISTTSVRESQNGDISDDTTEVDTNTPPTPLGLDPEKTKEIDLPPAGLGSSLQHQLASASNSNSDSNPAPRYKYEKLAQKHPKPTDHLSITIGPPIILLLDLIVPCIIYYTWYNIEISKWREECPSFATTASSSSSQTGTKGTNSSSSCPIKKAEFDKDILGYAIISFGFGELYILITRVWRLFAHREDCAPLLSRTRWDLDATSWVYGVAMMVALIPFVIGSTLEIPELYLYGPAFLMAFLGLLMVVTLIPFQIPIGINSHPRGTPLRPFIYYAAEDFIAVDGLQDREFRVRYNERYEASRGFRRMFLWLTLWWMAGVVIYIGCLSAVIWTLEFHYAFGLSLGILFSYIIVWACTSYIYVKIEMDRERRKFEECGRF